MIWELTWGTPICYAVTSRRVIENCEQITWIVTIIHVQHQSWQLVIVCASKLLLADILNLLQRSINLLTIFPHLSSTHNTLSTICPRIEALLSFFILSLSKDSGLTLMITLFDKGQEFIFLKLCISCLNHQIMKSAAKLPEPWRLLSIRDISVNNYFWKNRTISKMG